MSFSNDIARAMQEADASIAPRYYAGPAAPPNHSYACFVAQNAARRDKNPVQVFGILASAVKGLLTLGGATTTFEKPTPFTFPRYTLGVGGRLEEVRPVVASLEDLRGALGDEARWSRYIDQLARHDLFYDPLLMRRGPADRSAILRMVRRAYAQHEFRRRAAAIEGPEGFRDHPEVGPVLQAMAGDFARRCRGAGQVPMILLIHDRPYGDALFRLLGPTLEAERVPYFSTHLVAPTSDPANFVGDGHFTHAANERIGREALRVLRAAVAEKTVR
jgi:hypothetical protein